MRFRTTDIVLLGAVALTVPAAAQNTPASPAIVRTVLAAAKLPIAGDVPLYFKADRVTIQPGEKSGVSAANSMLYQISGSTQVSVGGEISTLSVGEGMFIVGGKTTSLEAGSSEPSTFLHFLLTAAMDLDQAAETGSGAVKELYRTAGPISDLKAGSYDLTLTRVTFPAQMPSNRPHHRSGAALYFIVSGTGSNNIDGNTEEKEPGSLIYEPMGLVHQWGNSGDVPFTFLVFNINPEGVPAVVSDAPAKTQ